MKSLVLVAAFLFVSTAAQAQQRVQGCTHAQAKSKSERVIEAKFFKENRRRGRAHAQAMAVIQTVPPIFAFEVTVTSADLGIPVTEVYELTLDAVCRVILGPTLTAAAQ